MLCTSLLHCVALWYLQVDVDFLHDVEHRSFLSPYNESKTEYLTEESFARIAAVQWWVFWLVCAIEDSLTKSCL